MSDRELQQKRGWKERLPFRRHKEQTTSAASVPDASKVCIIMTSFSLHLNHNLSTLLIVPSRSINLILILGPE